MDFAPSPEVAALRERVLDFMDAEIYPVERELTDAVDDEDDLVSASRDFTLNGLENCLV